MQQLDPYFIELNTNHILSPEQTERIGSVAVEAFYLLSRGIEHKSNLLTSIENALDKSKWCKKYF